MRQKEKKMQILDSQKNKEPFSRKPRVFNKGLFFFKKIASVLAKRAGWLLKAKQPMWE